ncbi:uncharacterized protein LOC106347164 isoform X2 [Brassica napus]|uniref:uncharacterized protein LOC106347164 isoform X2 n=1 Tax=Brassica napus TaxID=3708 RepID=UPI0020791543|nr:uncharacterized protein LOC106347164 isoform X2 [Brassica napus]
MPLLHKQPSTFSGSVDLPSSLLLFCSVSGTPKTSRSMVNSWESLYFSLMRSGSIVKVSRFELPDVVGKIHFVQGSDLKDAQVMTRVVVCFVIEPTVVVYLSLWDEAAAMFRGLISSGFVDLGSLRS